MFFFFLFIPKTLNVALDVQAFLRTLIKLMDYPLVEGKYPPDMTVALMHFSVAEQHAIFNFGHGSNFVWIPEMRNLSPWWWWDQEWQKRFLHRQESANQLTYEQLF